MNSSSEPAAVAAVQEGIAAVVVTHRSAATADACLARLRACREVAEIRVVDNASDDGTLEVVQRHASADLRVSFVANPDNPGFAVACNQGAADSASPWLAFVNPDCLVEPDTLPRLRRHAQAEMRALAEARSEAGAGGGSRNEVGTWTDPAALIGADLVDEDGVRDAAARRRDPDFAAMLRSPAAMRLGAPLDPDLARQRVDAVSGALMLMPRALFERVGGFDEGYRLHAEDLDLCRRVRLAGAPVAVANDVRVVHLRGVSSRSRPLFVEWHKHRGLWRYFRKFEAARTAAPVRFGVWCAVWAHFAFRAVASVAR